MSTVACCCPLGNVVLGGYAYPRLLPKVDVVDPGRQLESRRC
jgi:hypothetical protein